MREYTQAEADAIASRMNRKAERRDDWAVSRKRKADVAFSRSHDLTAGLPMGQPILAGHHSERRHRNAIEKSRNALSRGVEHSKMATEHERKAKAQRAWAKEVQRRAEGPRYSKTDLLPGDRICTRGNSVLDSVVVRANAKSVTAYAVYSQPVTDAAEPKPIWGFSHDHNPGRLPYLKVTAVFRLIDDAWIEIEPVRVDA